MLRFPIISSLFLGLALGSEQLKPGQWHPAVESDGMRKQHIHQHRRHLTYHLQQEVPVR